IVQGHVDQIATCIGKEDQQGSWIFTFQYDPTMGNITVEKGSITVNGISLTVVNSKVDSFSVAIIPYTTAHTNLKEVQIGSTVNSKVDSFSVAIIPYTIAHTNLREVQIGSTVNLEFDIVGKYIAKLLATRQ